jgi:hypothetical protein
MGKAKKQPVEEPTAKMAPSAPTPVVAPIAAKKTKKRHNNYRMFIKRVCKEVRTPNLKKESVNIVSNAFEACVDSLLDSLDSIMADNPKKNVTCRHITMALIGCSEKHGLSKKTLDSALSFTEGSLQRLQVQSE